jgi:hypothetical protein
MVASEAENFGLPTSRTLIIRYKREFVTYLQISPNPIIKELAPKASSIGNQNMKVAVGDFEVKGVSRKYGLDEIIGSGIDYIIDGKLRNSRLIGGIECTYITHQENSLTIDLTLQVRVGEQSMYGVGVETLQPTPKFY